MVFFYFLPEFEFFLSESGFSGFLDFLDSDILHPVDPDSDTSTVQVIVF